ncbi:hypothetical protein ANRL4_04574 [Anaerolineae bacterium]|nr:hypothetical protein ANRL4_04574 [Anaerolineae bacterium]
MLNLPIAMFKHLFVFVTLFLAQTANISIASPQSGAVLRGQVEIVGNMDVPNFASAELAFSYASNPADSWFTIQTFSQPVKEPVIAVWDTTALTDGDYVLHLRVTLQDGSVQDAVVSDLKIRNDVPLPTPSPSPTFPSQFSTPLPALTAQPVTALPTFPSPTSLPANPVSVTPTLINSNFARGALITLVLFAFFSLILRLRKN